MIQNNIQTEPKPEKLKILPESYIIADIETTGLNPSKESIIEISALKIDNDKVSEEFSMLVKPEKPISAFITNLTGITNEMTKNAQSKDKVLKKFLDFIEKRPIIGHNIRFDLSFINKNLEICFNKTLSNNYADTLYFSRRVYKELSSHKLTNIAEYLNIDTTNAHRALSDCYMTFQIIVDMKQKIDKSYLTSKSL